MPGETVRDDLEMEYVLELAAAFDKQARGHVSRTLILLLKLQPTLRTSSRSS